MSNSTAVAMAALAAVQRLQAELDALRATAVGTAAGLDILHLLSMGIFVTMMQLGFTFFEAGCVRKKNLTNIAMKNLGDIGASVLGYFIVGWAFAFGGGGNGFSGNSYFLLQGMPAELYAKFFFQASFVITSTTIISGAISERTRYPMYLIYSFAMGAVIYPFTTHWVWSSHGFLRRMGVIGAVDFAGGGPVHLLGACVSFAGAKIIGPRLRGSRATLAHVSSLDSSTMTLNMFSDATEMMSRGADAGAPTVGVRQGSTPGTGSTTPNNGGAATPQHGLAESGGTAALNVPRERGAGSSMSTNGESAREFSRRMQEVEEHVRAEMMGMSPISGHKPFYIIIGTMLLMIGWFGFNCGSTGGLSGDLSLVSSRVGVVTMIAMSTGMMVGVFYSIYFGKVGQYDVLDTCVGALGGLVAITPGCAVTEPAVALVVGAIGSLAANFGPRLIVRMGVDDPVGAVALHGFAATWGLIACGLFAKREYAEQVYMNGASITHGYGLFYGGGGLLLGVQLLEIVVVAAWGLVLGSVVFLTLRHFRMRVSMRDEIIGLDVCEHNQAVHAEERSAEQSEAMRKERHQVVSQVARRIDLKTKERSVERSANLFSSNAFEIYSVVGEVGIGKTTHAKLLAERLGGTYLSIIDLLQRSAVNHSSQTRILELINSKKIIPPPLICINLLKTAIQGTGVSVGPAGTLLGGSSRVAPLSPLPATTETAGGASGDAPPVPLQYAFGGASESALSIAKGLKRIYVLDGFPRDIEEMLAMQNEFGSCIRIVWLEGREKIHATPATDTQFRSYLHRKGLLIKVDVDRSQPATTNGDAVALAVSKFRSSSNTLHTQASQSATSTRQLAPWEA